MMIYPQLVQYGHFPPGLRWNVQVRPSFDSSQLVTAHSNSWTGFDPQLWGYCKCFYTSPHPT
jgi:hypothetical protein